MPRKKSTPKTQKPKKPKRRGCLTWLIVLFVLGFIGMFVPSEDNPSTIPESTYPADLITAEPTDAPTEAPIQTTEPTATTSPTAAPTPTIRPTATVAPTPAPTATPIPYAELSRGMKGDDVRQLQERLNELGYSVGTVDGSYGAKAVNGVSSFQKAAGLAVTGVATPETQAALYSPDAPRAPVSATQELPKATERPAVTEEPAEDRPAATEAPVVTDAPKPTKKPESSGGSESSGSGYVASVNSEVFHYPDCKSAKKILDKNRMTFSSRDKAVASGRRPCKECTP